MRLVIKVFMAGSGENGPVAKVVTAAGEDVPVRTEVPDEDERADGVPEETTSDRDWANDAAVISNALARIESFFI